MTIHFRPLGNDDLAMLLEWLQRPHVKEWWDDGDDTLEKVAAHYADVTDRTRRFILELDGEAAGYFQYYRIDTTWIGTDQFLACPNDLSKGLGTGCLLAFIDMIAVAEAPPCVAVDPHPANRRAIRCYEKCGFVHQRGRSTDTVYYMVRRLQAAPSAVQLPQLKRAIEGVAAAQQAGSTASMSGTPSKGDYLGQFEARGYAVVRGVFSAGEVAEMAAAFDRIRDRALAGRRSWRDRNIYFCLDEELGAGTVLRFAQWAAWIDPTLERVRRDPRLFAILEPLIGRDIKQIINQMHWKPPGARAEFGFHQDSRSRRPREAYRDLARSYVQTGIAVDPQRADNGAVVFCPGSQRLGELPFDPARPSMHEALDSQDLVRLGIDPASAVTLQLDPGDVALWHAHSLHGSGPNNSAMDRRFYINGYVTAANCDRGEWAFRDGVPCPLEGEHSLVHYEELYTKPGPMFVD
ncbi:MAG: GNAT family N-acetyltransferase [Kiloniellaceae bacterium]|nr:GNAT family N-acetyltransferase [Kiloniellaceae bacterium]